MSISEKDKKAKDSYTSSPWADDNFRIAQAAYVQQIKEQEINKQKINRQPNQEPSATVDVYCFSTPTFNNTTGY